MVDEKINIKALTILINETIIKWAALYKKQSKSSHSDFIISKVKEMLRKKVLNKYSAELLVNKVGEKLFDAFESAGPRYNKASGLIKRDFTKALLETRKLISNMSVEDMIDLPKKAEAVKKAKAKLTNVSKKVGAIDIKGEEKAKLTMEKFAKNWKRRLRKGLDVSKVKRVVRFDFNKMKKAKIDPVPHFIKLVIVAEKKLGSAAYEELKKQIKVLVPVMEKKLISAKLTNLQKEFKSIKIDEVFKQEKKTASVTDFASRIRAREGLGKITKGELKQIEEKQNLIEKTEKRLLGNLDEGKKIFTDYKEKDYLEAFREICQDTIDECKGTESLNAIKEVAQGFIDKIDKAKVLEKEVKYEGPKLK